MRGKLLRSQHASEGRNDRVKVKRPLVTVEVWCGTKPEQEKGKNNLTYWGGGREETRRAVNLFYTVINTHTAQSQEETV